LILNPSFSKRSITFQVGRTGVITPVANFDTVFISGTDVSRATL